MTSTFLHLNLDKTNVMFCPKHLRNSPTALVMIFFFGVPALRSQQEGPYGSGCLTDKSTVVLLHLTATLADLAALVNMLW